MTVSSKIKTARKIVYQGEPGSYSHLACTEALPHCEAIAAPTFEDAFAAIRANKADLGLIPIENSLHGRITDIHHLLPDETIYIVGEHFHRVRHQLLGVEGATLKTVKTAVSQEPALGQVRKVIAELGLKRQLWADTAGAARHVAELNDPSIAAVASTLAAQTHGLKILKPDIEDADHNVTRFLVMSAEPDDIDNSDAPVITTFIFRVRNVPAALYKALGGFATNGVNMTKLESYQLGGSFQATQFYADISGHPEERNVRLALEELQFFTSSVKVLGVYPAHPFRLADKGS
ncbi:MAG: prephenate dehydratase [Alphaproteobacteria bacterium]